MTTLEHALAFVLVFAALGAGVVTGAEFVLRVSGLGRSLALLLGAAVVALAGYLLFWLWLAAPAAGWTGWAILNAMLTVQLYRRRQPVLALLREVDVKVPLILWLLVGLADIGVLHFYKSDLPIEKLAANRFLVDLPCDNELPRLFAERLLENRSPRLLVGEWKSSDRPPLQTGIVFLAYPWTHFARMSVDLGGNVAGVWFQLLWIPGLWALMRVIGTRAGVAVLVTLASATTGFYLLHSDYAWPKLSTGALLLGAFVVYREEGTRGIRLAVTTASLLGLAWLSHGGAAFAMIGLALTVLVLGPRLQRNALIWGAGVFAVLAAPWVAYQRYYEPPGDELLKWHLAGSPNFDKRPLGELIAKGYGDAGFSGTVDNKLANFKKLFGASRFSWFNLTPRYVEERRLGEFFHFFRALGIWNVAFLLFPWIYLKRSSDAVSSLGRSVCGRVLLWTLLTLAVWVLLMFGPATTLIHQGVLSTVMVTFLMLMLAAYHVSPWVFGTLAILQVAHFSITWLPASRVLKSAAIDPAGIALTAVTVVALATVAWICRRSDSPPVIVAG